MLNCWHCIFIFFLISRGMRFGNVVVLTNRLEDIIKGMSYTWKDVIGLICQQNGVFRVNCVDCLDRTNVVQVRIQRKLYLIQLFVQSVRGFNCLQTQIAKEVLQFQLSKLGLIAPEGGLPPNLREVFNSLWANNGVSR
jgi:hypothetical protein